MQLAVAAGRDNFTNLVSLDIYVELEGLMIPQNNTVDEPDHLHTYTHLHIDRLLGPKTHNQYSLYLIGTQKSVFFAP